MLALAGLAWVFRSVKNDFSNGQINILLLLAGAGGALLMLRRDGWRWLGAVAVAVAVAVKLTPVIFLALPFLRRRWGVLAAALALATLLLVALPRLWFGPDRYDYISRRGAEVNSSLFLHAKDDDEQVSAYQLVFFAVTQLSLDGSRYRYDPDKVRLLEERDGAWVRAQLPELPIDRYARHLAVVLAFLGGAGYLAARWRLWGVRGDPPAGWDIAVLAVMLVFLSPLVRRAHTVAFLLPSLWLACWWAGQAARAGGLRAAMAARRTMAAAFLAVPLLMLAADDVPVPVPGLFPMPMHPSMFVAAVLLLGMLYVAGRDSAGDGSGGEGAQSGGPGAVPG